MKLQFLIPVYNEPFDVIKQLLDSIQIQQNIDFSEIGVVICSDGGIDMSKELNDENYKFNTEFHVCEHRGVSATRNACLDFATAEYVMFCDADDMFFNACGLYIIFREICDSGFDTLVSAFIEETRDPSTKQPFYITHEQDSTFVHGKVHRRKYLINNNIRWNDSLTIHEDSFFNCLCQRLTTDIKYCPSPFYLWKWRDESVCRHDPEYILKTYNNMLDSNTALVKEFKERRKYQEAKFFIISMIYDAYYTLNKKEWLNQDNQNYRDAVEARFKKYYEEFQTDFEAVTDDEKRMIIMGIKNRMFGEGLIMESITFDDWIKKIKGGE